MTARLDARPQDGQNRRIRARQVANRDRGSGGRADLRNVTAVHDRCEFPGHRIEQRDGGQVGRDALREIRRNHAHQFGAQDGLFTVEGGHQGEERPVAEFEGRAHRLHHPPGG